MGYAIKMDIRVLICIMRKPWLHSSFVDIYVILTWKCYKTGYYFIMWLTEAMLYVCLQMLLTPKDLSFVGYTYKNFEAVKGLRHPLGMRILLKYKFHSTCFFFYLLISWFNMVSSKW